jgi:hypothetical protein
MVGAARHVDPSPAELAPELQARLKARIARELGMRTRGEAMHAARAFDEPELRQAPERQEELAAGAVRPGLDRFEGEIAPAALKVGHPSAGARPRRENHASDADLTAGERGDLPREEAPERPGDALRVDRPLAGGKLALRGDPRIAVESA